MRIRTHKLCTCKHRKKDHYNGNCNECNRPCQFKSGILKNVVVQTLPEEDNANT